MTKIIRFSLLVFLVVFFSGSPASAQDPQFTEVYSAPLFLNPAFAGSAHHYRGTMHSRLQWPGLTAPYFTNLVSFDNFYNNQRSGVGVMLINDLQGVKLSGNKETNRMNTTELTAQYAYELHLSKDMAFRFGLQTSYLSRGLANDFIFPNQTTNQGVDPNLASGETNLTNRIHKVSFGTGGVLYEKNLYVGYAIHHINRPNMSFYNGGEDRLPMKTSFQAGYKIPLLHPKHMAYLEDEMDISVTPTVHYKFQGKSDQLDAGAYFIYDQILFGMWYRGIPFKKYDIDLHNNESMAFMFGFRFFDNYSFSYTYDAVVSKLSGFARGAHEINFSMIHLKSHKHSKPMKRIPCPTFYK